MGEQRGERRPALKLLPGGGGGERRALDRILGQPHAWLLKLGAGFAVLAALAFLTIPAFSRRAPVLTAEEVAVAMVASDGLGPAVAGLAEVLDLDAAQSVALKKTLERFDGVAAAPRRAREAALAVLRGAASGTGAEASAVDQALVRRREAQARLQALDAELVEAVSEGLSPSQKARVAIVLGHYLQRGGLEGHPQGPPGATAPASTAPSATTAPAAHP
jgi:hypothetical protein